MTWKCFVAIGFKWGLKELVHHQHQAGVVVTLLFLPLTMLMAGWNQLNSLLFLSIKAVLKLKSSLLSKLKVQQKWQK
jgi:hypothetical protein